MKLRENRGKIYGAQLLAGKILSPKELEPVSKDFGSESVQISVRNRLGLDNDRVYILWKTRSDVTRDGNGGVTPASPEKTDYSVGLYSLGCSRCFCELVGLVLQSVVHSVATYQDRQS
jgi:hypothetical protein